jgi:PIN domain nuclease of toxin-antitoxin system
VWWYEGNRKLGPRARRTIESHASAVHVSVASAWELAIKSHLGRLRFDSPLAVWLRSAITSNDFRLLTITLEHALAVEALAIGHGDPFDRMLVAQANVENLTLVTADTAFDAFHVKRLDARS